MTSRGTQAAIDNSQCEDMFSGTTLVGEGRNLAMTIAVFARRVAPARHAAER